MESNEEVQIESAQVSPSSMSLKDTTTLPNLTWLNGEEVEVDIYCYKNRITGDIYSVVLEPSDPNSILDSLDDEVVSAATHGEKLFSEHVIKSWWTIPSGRQLDRLREESASYNRAVGDYAVNPFRLKQKMFLYHLRKVDFIDPTTGNPLLLEFREDERSRSRLTEESEDRLSRIHPTILDTLYLKYRTVACLG